jgi:hypothetical protein
MNINIKNLKINGEKVEDFNFRIKSYSIIKAEEFNTDTTMYKGRWTNPIRRQWHSPGVYAFFDSDKGKKGKFLYVGRSNNVCMRVLQHIRSQTFREPPEYQKPELEKESNFIHFWLCDSFSCLLLEHILINKLKPTLNRYP